MSKKDASIRRDRWLRKSRRPRLRAAHRRILATAQERITSGWGARWESSTNQFIETREAVGHLIHRDVSDHTNRRRKIALGAGEIVGLSLAYSLSLDLTVLEGLLMSMGSAVAFLVAGDVGRHLKYAFEARLLARHPDSVPRKFGHLVDRSSAPAWLRTVAGTAVTAFVLGAICVGILRGSDGEGFFVPASFAVLSLVFMVAAALTSWGHASLFLPSIEFWRQESDEDEGRYKKAAKEKVLAQFTRDLELVALHNDRSDAYADARGHFGEAARYTMRTNNPQVFGYGKDDAPGSSAKEWADAQSSSGNGELPS